VVRRVLLAVVVVAAVTASAFVVTTYGRQIRSYVTKTKGSPSHTTAYVPFPTADAPLVRLAVAGDTGDAGSRLDETGLAMASIAKNDPFDLMLLLGDCVYPYGDPGRVEELVYEPFAPVLSSGTDLLAILGNHDVMKGRGDAELEAMGIDSRWWSVERDGLFLVGLDSTQAGDAEQHRWLERTLASDAAQSARWRVVALHHPPYSAGYQGSSREARAAFSPLFERYHVQLVLSGHDHDYQRSVPIGGVTYVVSGAGADTRRTGEADFTAVSFSWHHFLDVGVFADRLVVRAVNQERRVADEFTLR
jgi:3',5'-cyclic AMP phosphodiesterase CpdA